MSSADVKKIGEIENQNKVNSNIIQNTKCIETIEGIENIEILEGLQNLDYLRGIDNIIGETIEVVEVVEPEIEILEDNKEVSKTVEEVEEIEEPKIVEEIKENQIVEDVKDIEDIEDIEELVEAGKKIIESADKIVEVITTTHESKIETTVENVENPETTFISAIKKLGVTELLENTKSRFNTKKDNADNDEIEEIIDNEFINNIKPRIFRSKLNELNNREAPSTIQKLFKYTKKSHKFNNFQNFCRTLKIQYFKFKHKNIEFFEWQNTEESEKILLEFIKNINTNWSLKYHEYEKTVYNSKPLIHKRRMLYIDPYGYIEPGTTLYKVKIPYTIDEDKYLIKLID